jgi:ketosteroid isomerase-like protein
LFYPSFLDSHSPYAGTSYRNELYVKLSENADSLQKEMNSLALLTSPIFYGGFELNLKTTKMKLISIIITIVGLSIFPVSAQESCLNQENLKKVDASWEKAQLDLDFDFVNSLLSEDFIWVHNHANTIDNKAAVLERIKRYISTNNQSTRSRISREVKVIIYGTTAIVSGFTIVDRDPSPTTYHFMRTYAENNGKCYLIANQTMAIPENE